MGFILPAERPPRVAQPCAGRAAELRRGAGRCAAGSRVAAATLGRRSSRGKRRGRDRAGHRSALPHAWLAPVRDLPAPEGQLLAGGEFRHDRGGARARPRPGRTRGRRLRAARPPARTRGGVPGGCGGRCAADRHRQPQRAQRPARAATRPSARARGGERHRPAGGARAHRRALVPARLDDRPLAGRTPSRGRSPRADRVDSRTGGRGLGGLHRPRFPHGHRGQRGERRRRAPR